MTRLLQDVHIDCAHPGGEPPKDVLPTAALLMIGGFLAVSLACSAGAPTEMPVPEPVGSEEAEAALVEEPDAAEASAAAEGEKPACAPGGLQRVNHWEGEYPDPIVHVTGEMTLPSYVDPCDGKTSTLCAVTPGVYHPWGAGSGFVTLRQVQQFKATEALEVEGRDIARGEVIEIPAYLAEGYCSWRVRGEDFDSMCPDVAGLPLVELAAAAAKEVQLLDPGCGSWVEVRALLSQDGVTEGVVLEYGKVGPSED